MSKKHEIVDEPSYDVYEVNADERAYLSSVGVNFDDNTHECIFDSASGNYLVRTIVDQQFVAWIPAPTE